MRPLAGYFFTAKYIFRNNLVVSFFFSKLNGTPMKPKPTPPTSIFQKRTASLVISTFNKEARTIDVVFATNTPVLMRDEWGEQFYEILDMNPTSIDLTRLNAFAPMLDNHKIEDTESVRGVIEKTWVEGSEALATLRFDIDDAADKLMGKVERGIIRTLSVGYSVFKYVFEGNPEADIPTVRAISWQGYEISWAPIPADFKCTARSLIFNNIQKPKKPMLTKVEKRNKQIKADCKRYKLPDAFADGLIAKPIEELSLLKAIRSTIAVFIRCYLSRTGRERKAFSLYLSQVRDLL